MTTIHERRPFNLRYVCQQTLTGDGLDRRATHRTAQANFAYITRTDCIDEFGSTPNFEAKRADLVVTGRTGPLRSLKKQLAGSALWRQADQFADGRRPEQAKAAHIVGSLPQDKSPGEWQDLVRTFCEIQLASEGMVTDWAIHALRGDDGNWRKLPHCHLLVTTRTWDRDPGRRQARWFGCEEHERKAADAWYSLTQLWPDQRFELNNAD